MRLGSFQCHNHYHIRGLAYPCFTSSNTVTEKQTRVSEDRRKPTKKSNIFKGDVKKCLSFMLSLCIHNDYVVQKADRLATTYPCTDGPHRGHPKPGTTSKRNGNV